MKQPGIWTILLFSGFLGSIQTARADSFTITALNLPGPVTGIDDAGQIVGTYTNGGTTNGFLESNGALTTIDVPGSDATYVNGINNRGQIVGDYLLLSQYYGFVESNGVFTTVDVPSSYLDFSFSAINDYGELVGNYFDGTARHGFLDDNGVFTTIDFGSPTELTGINDAGQIVGLLSSGGFVSSGGVFSLIPNGGRPFSIDNLGQIAGMYIVEPLSYGFVYANGIFTTLNDPNAVNGTYPQGINDEGQVVGWYLDGLDQQHDFLATPAPESPALPLGLGLVGLCQAVRRSRRLNSQTPS